MSKSKLLLAREALSWMESELHSYGMTDEYRVRLATDVREVLNLHDELVTAFKDAYNIIQADANTEENYGSLCRIGSVMARIDAYDGERCDE